MRVEVIYIAIKNRDHSLKLEGLICAQSRLSPGHSTLPVLASKQSSLEAGIGGEGRVAEVLCKNSFPFEHLIIHDLSLTSDEKFQIDTNFFTLWYGLAFETKNISGSLDFRENPGR